MEDPGPGTVVVYSEAGDKFTLHLNGEQRNATPMTRVVIENFKEVPISFRIVFTDGSPELTKKGIRQGVYCIYAIDKGKKGNVLRVKGCSESAPAGETVQLQPPIQEGEGIPMDQPAPPAQLSATYANGVISINDGRKIKVNKVKATGMTYPRVIMTTLQGAKVAITYDDNTEKYSAESPLQYEVKDYQLNNAYFTLTVDEGGAAKTWHVKLQNANGYDLKIEE